VSDNFDFAYTCLDSGKLMAEQDKLVEMQQSPNGSSGSATLAVVLALLLALSTSVAAVRLQNSNLPLMQPVILIIAALFVFVGLIAIFGWISGLIRFAGRDPDRSFFDSLTDAIVDPIVITDDKGRAIYANAPFLKLASRAGVSRLVGFDVLYAGYREFAEPIYQIAQMLNDGQSGTRDVRVAAGSSMPGAAADSARWLRVSVAPIAGNVRRARGLWRLIDITADRVHQEQAFSRLQFIITYLDNAPVGFFSTLPNGTVDYVNATLADWLGIDLVQAQSGKMSLDKLVGEDGARLLSAVETVKGGNRIDRLQFPIADAKGVPHVYDVTSRSDFDVDGNSLPSRAMVMRLSSDAKTDVPLYNVAQFLAAVPIGVGELDGNGILMNANAEFLALSPSMKLGSPLKLVLLDGADLVRSALEQSVEIGGSTMHANCMFIGDPPRAAQLTFIQLEGMKGRVSVFALDKTESKSLETQLAQSQKMQAVGELASGIAHDFNNVLTPIIGFADLLLTKMRPTDAAFADVMNIKQNANRAANLVRQLLAFSRKQTLQPKVHDLSEALSDLGNLLNRVLGEKTELSISHGRDLGLVLVDIHQFEQVIINLAVNARDAMPKGGKLSVRTYNLSKEESQNVGHVLPHIDHVVCEVEDNGTGIPKDILEKIWAPFFTTKEVGKGTGLGLSMVYGIVKQTGGYIYCDSEMGRGTTFKIYLPRYVPDAFAPVADVEVKSIEPKREDFSGRGRILVVEDEDSVRAFAVRALSTRGYTVLEADSGEAGLEVLKDDKDGFELILSDVVMPEMDGPTMLKELRKLGIKTKVIFMSGYAEDAFEKNLEGASDFAFLQKPFSLKQLVEKVKDVMA
jgi:two-component system, cell cycle sensor histidine kinase and response regulator CckA